MDKIKNFYMNLSSKKKGKILLITQIIAWFIWAWLSWKGYQKKTSLYDFIYFSSMFLSLPLIIKLLKFNILDTPDLKKSIKKTCMIFFFIGVLNIIFSLVFGYSQRSQLELVDSNSEFNKLKESFEKKCPDPANTNRKKPITLEALDEKSYDSVFTQECISELIKTKECQEKYQEVRNNLKYTTREEFISSGDFIRLMDASYYLKECNFNFLHSKFNLPEYQKIENARMNIKRKYDKKNLGMGFLVAGISIGVWVLYILIPILFKKFKNWFNRE
jgi:hypothetical protein